MLTVRNTAKNINTVDTLVEQALNVSPKMAVIEVKIVEIGNNKLDEMGFDWLLDAFGTQMEFAGGTVGNAQGSAFKINEFPENSALGKAGMGPVTSGLRSSGDLQANRSIEDVLYGAVSPASKRSPGILSLAGVLTNPQFQVVWRALDQKTGIDLVSRPSVIAKSGQKASVEIVRELIYPTEYDPPQIPTNIGNNTVTIIDGVVQPQGPLPPIPVTPTTPTAFETRRVGMVLDVEPVISEDGRSVDLTVTPEFTEFVGFVNYGSPINNVMTVGGGSFKTELTPNIITQPIFSTKKVVTAVKVYDGATVVLGGLVSDQSIVIDDRVPLIGSLPLVGKLFQSKVKQRRMKNMIMFVTVKVVDPSGNRVNPQ
jgi:general secretion pathway protein D